eukprot:scaffold55677_cov39-Cyclotella_meneghiniana.AAC.1
MNGMTRLRLEFIVHNGHHKLTLESWLGDTHSCWAVPMSHHKYNEWYDKAEIGIQCPQCSPQADF